MPHRVTVLAKKRAAGKGGGGRKTFADRSLLLASALTPAEAVTQLSTFSFTSNHSGVVPGVPRLRLPPYNYHSEGLHGVRDSCDKPSATLWPQVASESQ